MLVDTIVTMITHGSVIKCEKRQNCCRDKMIIKTGFFPTMTMFSPLFCSFLRSTVIMKTL